MRGILIGWLLFATFISSAVENVYQAPDPEPTDAEVAILELMNRFRANPAAEAELIMAEKKGRYPGVDWDMFMTEIKALKPAPPVVMNMNLLDAARKHSHYMILNEMVHMETPGAPGFTGVSPADRCAAAGYRGAGAENCYKNPSGPWDSQCGFVVDIGEGPGGMQPNRGHRMNMINASFREIGASAVPHSGRISITHNFGRRGGGRMACGVAYVDSNGNNFYDMGEGLGRIKIAGSDGSLTETWKSGGYTLECSSKVTLTAEYLGQKFTKAFEGGNQNIKFDVIVTPAILNAHVDKLIEAVIAQTDPLSPAHRDAALNLYLQAKWLRLDAEHKKKLDELTQTVATNFEARQAAVREALDNNFDPVNFFKVQEEQVKAYRGTPGEKWFQDASLIARMKVKVITFEAQNKLAKVPIQQRRNLATELEGFEAQLSTAAFRGESAALVARVKTPGKEQAEVAANGSSAGRPAETDGPREVIPTLPAQNSAANAAAPESKGAAAPAPSSAREFTAPKQATASAEGQRVSDKSLAALNEKVRQRVLEGIKGGQKPGAYLNLFGKPKAVKVVGADEKDILVDMDGGKLNVSWLKLDARKDHLGLARAFAREESASDHVLVAAFMIANEQYKEAEDEFRKVLTIDPKTGAELIEALKKSLQE